MDIKSIRELACKTPRKTEPIETPFWDGTDGAIAIGDMGVDELNTLGEIQKTSPTNYSSTFICYALVSRETGERIFGKTNEKGEFIPTDRDWIKGQVSVITEILPQIQAFFGFDKPARQAIDDAKKNLLQELVLLGILSPSELPAHLSQLLNK